MDKVKETTGPSPGISDGTSVSNHRIGSAGTVIGDPFVNPLGEKMVWVRYKSGIKVERFEDLIEIGIFKNTQ
tara:strand:- start:2456 stop:2671 length:216 start_codon:yes stop_codon:yes gene_type:complete